MQNKIYFENLDGLRFLAFLAVFVSHSAIFFGYNTDSLFFSNLKKFVLVHGDLGVTFFLVLSGFLLTYLFLEEKKNKGTINTKLFFRKRAVRIIPVYMLTLLLGFLVVPFIASFFSTEFPFFTGYKFDGAIWYLVLLGNLHMTFFNAPNLIVGVMWFISAQEQFYLFWPSVIKKLSQKRFLYAIISIILTPFIFRLFFVYNYNITHYFTLSIISDIGVGALLAYALEYLPNFREKFVNMTHTKIALIYFLILVLIPIKGWLGDPIDGIWYRLSVAILPTVFAVLFAFVIAEQNFSINSIFKFGKSKILTYLGRISYGLYAYHIVALFTVLAFMKILGIHTKYDDLGTYFSVIIFTFLFTLLFAHLSYKNFEQKFLKFKLKINKQNP